MVGRPALQLVSRTFDCNAISLPRCTGSPVPRPGFFLLSDRLAVWARTSRYASLRTRKLANDAPAPRGLAMRALGAPTYLMPDPPRPCLRRGTRPNKNARSCRALCCASSQWPPKRYRSWHGEQNVASDHPVGVDGARGTTTKEWYARIPNTGHAGLAVSAAVLSAVLR